MTVLLVGASGATGSLLVQQLLTRGVQVRAVVRHESNLPETLENQEGLTIIKGTILDMTEKEVADAIQGCDAIASCLGHNMSLKGLYGKPHKLVRDTARRLCRAIEAQKPDAPIKYVLMNTTGNRNRDLSEKISFGERLVVGLIRLLLPPHSDNEKASEVLRLEIGQKHPGIEWVVVRPDGLVNEQEVSAYSQHPSPIRSSIFDPGTTSRINVAHFMAELLTDSQLWARWRGQMPVIYNE